MSLLIRQFRQYFPKNLLLFSALALAGCGLSGSAVPLAAPATAEGQGDLSTPGESWGAIFVSGNRVGHEHTQVSRLEEGGRALIQTRQLQRLSVQRFGDKSQPGVELISVETPGGQLVRFTSRQVMGPTPIEASGQVQNGVLRVEVKTTGKASATTVPWSAQDGGFFAVEQSLARQPLKSGQRRTLRLLDPLLYQAIDWQLVARSTESTQLLDGPRELLRIEATATYPTGQTMTATAWVDAQGVIRKTRLPGAQEIYRTTKEIALRPSEGLPFDLGIATTIKLDRPLPHGHRSGHARYRVQLASDDDTPPDPAKIFPSSSTQHVSALDHKTAELTVRSVKPGALPDPAAKIETAADADRLPNNMIQSDDAAIVALAHEAAGAQGDPVQVALLLEQQVHKSIRKVNFSQAFATASDVLKSVEGDCTEHAVLLAALARARQIPARVAVGLVYVESMQAFGFHMWNELYLNGQWVGLDGTLGQGGIGAGHLKLSHSNLAGGEGFASFLPVAQVMGRIKIELLEANEPESGHHN